MYLNPTAPCEKLRSTRARARQRLAACATFAGLSCLLLAAALPAGAQPLYWDINGATAGAGGPVATGTWDGALLNWNSLADGTAATGAWISGRNAVFSAGSDASGAFVVTVSGNQTAGAMTIEEGLVTIAGGAVVLGT